MHPVSLGCFKRAAFRAKDLPEKTIYKDEAKCEIVEMLNTERDHCLKYEKETVGWLGRKKCKTQCVFKAFLHTCAILS